VGQQGRDDSINSSVPIQSDYIHVQIKETVHCDCGNWYCMYLYPMMMETRINSMFAPKSTKEVI